MGASADLRSGNDGRTLSTPHTPLSAPSRGYPHPRWQDSPDENSHSRSATESRGRTNSWAPRKDVNSPPHSAPAVQESQSNRRRLSLADQIRDEGKARQDVREALPTPMEVDKPDVRNVSLKLWGSTSALDTVEGPCFQRVSTDEAYIHGIDAAPPPPQPPAASSPVVMNGRARRNDHTPYHPQTRGPPEPFRRPLAVMARAMPTKVSGSNDVPVNPIRVWGTKADRSFPETNVPPPVSFPLCHHPTIHSLSDPTGSD